MKNKKSKSILKTTGYDNIMLYG